MIGMKEEIEKEINDAHEEYVKLNSHVKLYITEMEQAI
jgi:kinetochore protein Nuf2